MNDNATPDEGGWVCPHTPPCLVHIHEDENDNESWTEWIDCNPACAETCDDCGRTDGSHDPDVEH